MMLLAADPASLDKLHDTVVPPPVPFWPPATGWYWVMGLGTLLVLSLACKLIEHWHRNRYRRAGLLELARLETARSDPHTLPELAALVKRVALAAFPRTDVAALSGSEWLRFLDEREGTKVFTVGPGAILESGYARQPPLASRELFDAVRHWITHHKVN